MRRAIAEHRWGKDYGRIGHFVAEQEADKFWHWFKGGGVPGRALELYWRALHAVSPGRMYLQHRGHADGRECRACGAATDDTGHWLLHCPRTLECWSLLHEILERKVGRITDARMTTAREAMAGYPMLRGRQVRSGKDRTKVRLFLCLAVETLHNAWFQLARDNTPLPTRRRRPNSPGYFGTSYNSRQGSNKSATEFAPLQDHQHNHVISSNTQ